MDTELLDLIHNYLRRREALKRRVAILERVIEAQERGETITPSVLEEYASQLENVTTEPSNRLEWRYLN